MTVRPARLGWGLGLGFGLVVVIGAAGPASGHAELVSSSPAAGAVLPAAPARITLAFEERPDPTLSSIEVVDGSGSVLGIGPVGVAPGRPKELAIPLPLLPDGSYTVAWRAVSAIDGQRGSGSFSFGVRVAVVAVAGRSAERDRPAGVAWSAVGARSLYYLGVTGLLGVAFVTLAVFRRPPEPVLRLGLCGSLVAGIAGAVGIIAAQASADGVGLGRFLSSSGGPGAVARVAPLLEAAVPIAAVLVWRGRRRRAPLAAVAAYAALSMLADVHASHAAAAPSWAWLHITVLWAHFLAVAVWIGGLAVVLACLPRIDRAQRTRGLAAYSTAAAVALFVVAGSGTAEAVTEVGTWRALMTTGFGRLVLVKVGVLAVLAALGALNRYRNVPRARASRSVAPLRRVALIEVGLAVGALAAAAILPTLSPPREAPSAGGGVASASARSFGG